LVANITTLTFFKYKNWWNKIWAFGMMQFAHSYLAKQSGIQFYKLMGSGKGKGFNPFPDWSTYSLLVVWENEKSAQDFFAQSDLFQKYRSHTSERWTIFMKNILARGSWSKKNPFDLHPDLDTSNELLCIITRATIRWNKLYSFWKYVPTSEKPLADNNGLIYTKGIGEIPVIQMATFSVWKNMDALKKFAYESEAHRVAIQKTRELDWYSEEMFCRFQPYKSVGTWEGKNPLESLPQEL
jgi:heme-degrading monooxygenase HmoA